MRAVMVGMAVAVLMAAAGGTAAGRDEKIDAKLLVGKWTPKEEDKKGQFVVEFTKDGKVLLSAPGKEFKAEGTYKLDGNKLSFKMKFGGEEKSQVRTVHSLTKSELVSSDEKDRKDTLIRVGDKK
jgi:uncharacterized protein (TIGR03066 family)